MKIVVSTEVAPMCPFKAAMACLKASMLTHFAKEAGLECEPRYSAHFVDYEVEAGEDEGLNLIHELVRKGCVDVHVYAADPVTRSLLNALHPGLLRVCDTGGAAMKSSDQ